MGIGIYEIGYLYFFATFSWVGIIVLLYTIKKRKFGTPLVPGEGKKYERGKKVVIGTRIFIYGVAFIGLLGGVRYLGIPAILDSPYIISGNYPVAEGTVISNTRTAITIQESGSNKEMHFRLRSDYKSGDHIRLEYMPNSEIAAPIDK